MKAHREKLLSASCIVSASLPPEALLRAGAEIARRLRLRRLLERVRQLARLGAQT